MKQERVTLTSRDPEYRHKVEVIHQTLRQLKDDEAFFQLMNLVRLQSKCRVENLCKGQSSFG